MAMDWKQPFEQELFPKTSFGVYSLSFCLLAISAPFSHPSILPGNHPCSSFFFPRTFFVRPFYPTYPSVTLPLPLSASILLSSLWTWTLAAPAWIGIAVAKENWREKVLRRLTGKGGGEGRSLSLSFSAVCRLRREGKGGRDVDN